MEVREILDDEEEKYTKYTIIFTLLHGNSLNQMKNEVYFTNEEAKSAFNILNSKIIDLERINSPVGISLVTRNSDGEIIRRGLTGIVGIEHNIPYFKEVLD